MKGDYYPQPDDDEDQASPSEAASDPGEPGEEPMAGETALVPASMLGGKEMNPGDEITFKIVKLHGDQVEVEFSGPAGGEQDGAGSEMDQAQDRMGQLKMME